MDQYKAFHGMLCSPTTASSCIQSFQRNNGCIFFAPSYLITTDKHKNKGNSISDKVDFSSHDFSYTLNTFYYYVLCLAVPFSLCTVLGQTEFIEGVEFSNGPMNVLKNKEEERMMMQSVVVPHEIRVTEAVLAHVQHHIRNNNNNNNTSSSSSSSCETTLLLKRKFEYNFKLCFVNVIMLHFVSFSGKEKEEKEVLHLVEIYRFRHPMVQKIAALIHLIVSFTMLLVDFFLGTKKKVKVDDKFD